MMPDYDPGNRAAALIILQDPARYDGLMTDWAKLWLEEHPNHGTPRKRDRTIICHANRST